MPTHYEVLGVTSEATEEELRQSYRDCARQAHPDLHSGSQSADLDNPHQRMAEINEAYRVLCDPDLRAVYDRSLEAQVSIEHEAAYQSSPPQTPRLMRGLLAIILLGLGWMIVANQLNPHKRQFREELKTAQQLFKPTVDQALKGELPSLQETMKSPEGLIIQKALAPPLSLHNCLQAFPDQLKIK